MYLLGVVGSPGEAKGGHVPVLLDRVVEALSPREGEVFVDCTAGSGGHAEAIAARVGRTGVVVLNDADQGGLEGARARVEAIPGCPPVHALHGNFVDVGRRVVALGLGADMVLADLGFASTQVGDPERGMSFMRDGPLDMRFDRSAGPTAADLVNTLSEGELGEILREYGEERGAARIASKIVAERGRAPITTTARLASIVQSVLGPHGGGPRIHPATRTFQALRIAVNDELASLRSLLGSIAAQATQTTGTPWLAPGARVAIISFHSLEDRQVKHAFRDMSDRGAGQMLTRGAAKAGEDEIGANRRSRSARLRAARLSDPARPEKTDVGGV